MAGELKIERAAGGLVVRTVKNQREALLIDDAYGHVALPKGHVEPGESWEEAAIREIEEETGIEARILAPLGRVEYPIVRDGEAVRKQVRMFLLEAVDNAQEPRPQLEELDRAYYRLWDEAVALHDERGYANWRWLFAKAQVLLQWHTQQWETRWRQLPANDSLQIDRMWPDVAPWTKRLFEALDMELSATFPEMSRPWETASPENGFRERPLPASPDEAAQAVQGAIEHTLLKPEASVLDILRICQEARNHHFAAVCVNPRHTAEVHRALAGSGVGTCVVVGFPLGAVTAKMLGEETRQVMELGADEIDCVIPVGAMREDDVWTVYEHVAAVCRAAHADAAHPKVVKAILENHFLTYEQVAKASWVALAAGADFVKTSTGFAPSGARVADVALMAQAAASTGRVKAAGGIRTREDAVNFLRYGAARLGTSSGALLVGKDAFD
uniref:deoxyribose-phosphate aldolase n=1 Tax=Alicyclobacillus tolerans TaxID=90970 RepID=UPI00235121E5|nr:deoxyribose-phosphate aldolase [Alicyclobacillus tolerans]